ncbi:hypothetical protein [Sutcliffiella rhizosphaerae]|uniref:Uncharacterized protein n=1 Tax=Sutcliffiella rhizosphaerae TaxID=2880967 RepID=A0ABN8AGY6_9BACI|nr:hypothetical protein [Sutcliffiella rhizosphaerae]CAG9622343.1 hypothetical protein BACCIP111883_03134 [Sutcliffiella rhizosphaerae]
MRIKEIKGYELEKAQSNTSEDFFNRSIVTFEYEGVERTFHVLYIRYFDETFAEFIPVLENRHNPIFEVAGEGVTFKDIVAITCLIKNPRFRNRKRIYINTREELASYFEGIQIDKLKKVFEELYKNDFYELTSPLKFLVPSYSNNKG